MKNENIGRVLKKLRKQNAMSVRDVVEKLEEKSVTVAAKTLYGWESGQSSPNVNTFLLLCRIYHVNDVLATFGYRPPRPSYPTIPEFLEAYMLSLKNASEEFAKSGMPGNPFLHSAEYEWPFFPDNASRIQRRTKKASRPKKK